MSQVDRPTVLVVEDEFIVALDLSETVRDLGYDVDGPYADTRNAFSAIDRTMPDFAILDITPQTVKSIRWRTLLARPACRSSSIRVTSPRPRFPLAIPTHGLVRSPARRAN